MNNIDENNLGKLCGIQRIMRYSTSGEQYLETSLILDITHQQLLTNRDTPPQLILPAVAALEVSNPCSDVQTLFSVIRDSSSNIMYQISYKQCEKTYKIVQLLRSP